jgi:hypothetical protein
VLALGPQYYRRTDLVACPVQGKRSTGDCDRAGRALSANPARSPALRYFWPSSSRTSENSVKGKFALFYRPALDRVLCKQGHAPVIST